jgi:hypothetical protein
MFLPLNSISKYFFSITLGVYPSLKEHNHATHAPLEIPPPAQCHAAKVSGVDDEKKQ